MTDVVFVMTLAVLMAAIHGTSLWLVRRSASYGPSAAATMPVGPSLVAVLGLFTFGVSLHGNDLMGDFDREMATGPRVLGKVEALRRLAATGPFAAPPSLRAAIERYEGLAASLTWTAYATVGGTRDLDEALRDLGAECRAPRAGLSDTLLVHGMRLYDELAELHAERARAYSRAPNWRIWTSMFLMCLFSNVATGLVNQDKPGATWRILLVFNVATFTLFYAMARYEFRAVLYAVVQRLSS